MTGNLETPSICLFFIHYYNFSLGIPKFGP
jgi:hypothetical protein